MEELTLGVVAGAAWDFSRQGRCLANCRLEVGVGTACLAPVPVQAGIAAVHRPEGLHRSSLSPLSVNPALHPKEQVVSNPKAPRRCLQDMVPCSGVERAGHRTGGVGAAATPAVRKCLHLQSPQ